MAASNSGTLGSQFTGRVVAGRYRLGARRGAGVDAAVFDAYDQELQRVVSLKVVHPDLSGNPEFQLSFRRTMDVAATLHHPNIAVQYEWGSDHWNGRETLFVVQEHLTAGSLRDLLDRGRLLSPSQALAVALDACKALDLVHRAGLIHGDIRPSTLVFGDDRRLRVIDVGLGQLLGDVLWSDAVHVSNERAAYASPEVAARHPPVPKSDVYSLCLTVLESVTGSIPFLGDSTVATLGNRIGKLMPVSADLGALAAVLERAGRPIAGDRYSAAEFGKALVQTAGKLPRPAPLPILGALLYADRPVANEPADPTGLLMRPSEDPRTDSAPPADGAPLTDGDPSDGGGPPTEAVAALSFSSPMGPAVPLPPPTAPLLVDAQHDDASAPGEPASENAGEQEQELPQVLSVPIPPSPAPTEVMDVIAFAPSPATEVMDLTEPLAPTEMMPATAMLATPAAPGASPPVQLYDEGLTGRRRRFLWWLVPVLLILAAAGAVVAYVVNRVDKHTVPELAGMTEGEALAAVAASNWETSTPEEASETVPVGQVVRTDPAAGTTLREDRRLVIVISTGPAPRQLPELAGLSLADATAELTELGLLIEQGDPVFDDAVPAGSVVSWTFPAQEGLQAGDTVPVGSTIRVVLSKGAQPVLPELTGRTVDDATASLTAIGLAIDVAEGVFDETAPVGQILSWSVPAQPVLVAGGRVDPGTVVQVVPSAGPAPRTVPNLAGVAAADAKAAVESLGLVFAQVPDEFSSTVPVGRILRQDPAAGASVPRGAIVNVAVSKGPELVPIPTVVGLTLQPAIDALRGGGLAIGTISGNPEGTVTGVQLGGAQVATDQTVARGTAIDLTLT